jgi:hypothetical protein
MKSPHLGDFIMFSPMMQELLNIDHFLQKTNSTKIKTESFSQIEISCWYYWEAVAEYVEVIL